VVDTSGSDGSNNNNKYYSFGGILKMETIDYVDRNRIYSGSYRLHGIYNSMG